MSNENHADIIDSANELNQLQVDLAIKHIRSQLNTGEKPAYKNGLRICLDCESFILIERIRINPNVVRCVHCQRELELENRLYPTGRYRYA